MTDAEAPNQKSVSVPITVPRDPSAYEPTLHFQQRLRDRVPADERDRVVRQTIALGWMRGTTPPKGHDRDGDIWQHFAFDWHDDKLERDWRVVVGIVREAFVDTRRKHLAVTIVDRGDGE